MSERYCHVTEGAVDHGPGALPNSWQDPTDGTTHTAVRRRDAAWLKDHGWYRFVEDAGTDRYSDRGNFTDTIDDVAGEVVRSSYGDIALTAAQAMATSFVDTAAEDARLAYITTGAGQALIYEAKRREAAKWQAIVDASGTPDPADFPLIDGRATRLSATHQSVADEWNARAAEWTAAAIAIEAAREGAKEAITDAADVAAIRTAIAGTAWPAPS